MLGGGDGGEWDSSMQVSNPGAVPTEAKPNTTDAVRCKIPGRLVPSDFTILGRGLW